MVGPQPDVHRAGHWIGDEAESQLEDDGSLVDNRGLPIFVGTFDDQPSRVVTETSSTDQKAESRAVVPLIESEVDALVPFLPLAANPPRRHISIEGIGKPF